MKARNNLWNNWNKFWKTRTKNWNSEQKTYGIWTSKLFWKHEQIYKFRTFLNEKIWNSKPFCKIQTKFQIQNIFYENVTNFRKCKQNFETPEQLWICEQHLEHFFEISIHFCICKQNLNMWTVFVFVNKFWKWELFLK